jgi:hypothetical protein
VKETNMSKRRQLGASTAQHGKSHGGHFRQSSFLSSEVVRLVKEGRCRTAFAAMLGAQGFLSRGAMEWQYSKSVGPITVSHDHAKERFLKAADAFGDHCVLNKK